MHTNFRTGFLSFLLVTGAILSNCTKTKTFEINFDEQIVVNSIISPDSNLRVAIYKSKSPESEINFEPLQGAIVRLIEGNQSWNLDRFVPSGSYNDIGYYTSASNLDIETGKLHQLVIEPTGYPSITAQTQVPIAPNISQATLSNISTNAYPPTNINKGYYLGADAKFNIQDPPNEKNFYCVKIKYISDYILDKSILPYKFIDSNSIKTIGLNINNISNVFISYLIEGGFIFTDEGFDGQNKEIEARIQGGLELKTNFPEKITLEVWALNEDYYKYIKSHQKQVSIDNDPFAEPLNVYSNIDKGIGIFCGYSVAKFQLPL